MTANLLDYFYQELDYLNQAGEEFAKLHPKLASNLKLTAQGSKDPQVAMLFEGVALLNARIYSKLNEKFPKVTENLLNMLYPHYLAPLPAMSVVQFIPATDLSQCHVVPAATELETDPSIAERCCFRTTQDSYLLPIAIEHISLTQNLPALHLPKELTYASGLILKLRCLDPDMTFAQLQPKKLRCFLQGQWHHRLPLYELLIKSTQAVALVDDHSATPLLLGPESIQAVGFEENEGLLPYGSRSAHAYRLLTEYFIYPEKFSFIDINLDQANFENFKNSLTIIVYLHKNNQQIMPHVHANTFALNATPVINLFSTVLEPITVDHKHFQYPLFADHRRPDEIEIYSVDEVTAINDKNEVSTYLPFYGLHAENDPTTQHTYWSIHREKNTNNEGHYYSAKTFLSLVNLDLAPNAPDKTVLHIKATCTNRELPKAILYPEHPVILQLASGSAPISGAQFLLIPSTLRPPLANHQSMSVLLAHLALNYVNLVDPKHALDHLKQIIRLYQGPDDINSNQVNSLIEMKFCKIVRRMPAGIYQAFCQGIKIQITIDERYFPGESTELFALILEKFFQLYVTINNFIELEIISNKTQRPLFQGKPLAGGKYLL